MTYSVTVTQPVNAVSTSQTTHAAAITQPVGAVSVTMGDALPTARTMPDFTITDFTEDILDWWARHPLNDGSKYYLETVVSPTNVIDVQNDYAGSLQDAIDALPVTGGKLLLTAGTYDLANVTGKSNVHFIGSGTASTIILRGVELWGGADCATYAGWAAAVGAKTPSAMALIANRPRNFYFSNLTFNGDNNPPYTNGYGLNCRGVREVLVDDCTFTNYALYTSVTHIGPVTVHGYCDNIYFRRCHFGPPGYEAIYMDGVHGAGMIDCTFDDGFDNGRITLLTNDDFTCDVNGSGAYETNELRQSCYVVEHGNTFLCNGVADHDIIVANVFHHLIEQNVVSGGANGHPVTLSTRLGRPGAYYTSLDQHIINNTFQNCVYLVSVNATIGIGVPPNTTGTVGQLTVTGNTVTAASIFVDYVEYIGTPVGPNVVQDNTIISA
jgi:hypothetical protein